MAIMNEVVAAPATAGAAVSLAGVVKRFGRDERSVLALDRVSLTVGRGSFVCLVGASGCGKSTLLSLVAGLDRAGGGTVEVAGRTALLFQEAALFPWLTASRNVEMPMRLRGVPRAQRRARAAELLDMVHLHGFGDRRPHELSGGMRQRVALARALAQEADVLLMDEPFGSLDEITRDRLHDELERVWQATGVTIMFVTHSVREAVRLGDRIVLMSSRPGRVAAEFAVGAPRPRRSEAAIAELTTAITERLRAEVRRHVTA